MLAAHIRHIIKDIHIFGKLQLQTLEGPQPLMDGGMLCTGINRTDPWQQPFSKIKEKYTIEDVTPDGWLYCVPKPGNAINCVQVTQETLNKVIEASGKFAVASTSFFIKAQWGDQWLNPQTQEQFFAQLGTVGDYVCQSQNDLNDFWIVQKNIFEASYEIQQNDTTTGNIQEDVNGSNPNVDDGSGRKQVPDN